jgi:hypothetical protein
MRMFVIGSRQRESLLCMQAVVAELIAALSISEDTARVEEGVAPCPSSHSATSALNTLSRA